MKKYSLLTLVFLLLHVTIVSQNKIDIDAYKVATNKLAQISRTDGYFSIKNQIPYLNQKEEILFFVFEINPVGYIVVSANKNLPPIIAYSLNSNISINEKNNPLIYLLNTDISTRLNNLNTYSNAAIINNSNQWNALITNRNNHKSNITYWPPEGTTLTGGWIETNWTQSYPYNQFCPNDPITGSRSYVGCPATAMAQVLNYYQTHNSTSFDDDDDYYHSYAGRNYWIDDDYLLNDFLSFTKINSFLDTITYKLENGIAIEGEDAAALSFACGVAAHQVFTSEGSGTFGVDQALDAYTRFGFYEAELIYENDTNMFPTMEQNMKDGRPAHLAVVNESYTSGHNVVLDGYNSDNFYHINFGWGGSNNGWYLLPQQFPLGLTVIEGVVTNIAYPPINTGKTNIMEHSSLKVYPNPASTVINISVDNDESETISIKIFDNTGRVIFTENKNDGDELQIHLGKDIDESLTSGIYLVVVETGGKSYTRKVIITN